MQEPITWYDDLMWCPSQCYGFTVRNSIPYCLYLRWRWQDPWNGYIVTGATNENFGPGILYMIDYNAGTSTAERGNQKIVEPPDSAWTGELFRKYHIQYADEELDMAKAKLIEIFDEIYPDQTI